MGLGAGQFDQRIRIERKGTPTRAPNGDEIAAWEPVAEVWARVEPMRAREWFAAAQAQSGADYRVTIRYRLGITADMRVVWIRTGQVLDIVGEPIDINGRRQDLELMCASGARNSI